MLACAFRDVFLLQERLRMVEGLAFNVLGVGARVGSCRIPCLVPNFGGISPCLQEPRLYATSVCLLGEACKEVAPS